MSNGKRWTPKDEEVLKKCIKKYYKRKDAFKAAAEETGRTTKSVELHYYQSQRSKCVLALNTQETPNKPVLLSFMMSIKKLLSF